MSSILIFRDSLRQLYSRFDYVIRPVSKFILAFLMLSVLQANVGYYELLNRIIVIAATSALCMFLPFGSISFICGIFLIADMLAVSYAMAGFAAGLLLLILVLYYGFRPGTGILMALVPFAFFLKIPFVIPVVLGMSVGIFSIIPASLGVIIWNLVKYFAVNAEALASASSADIMDSFIAISRGVLTDRYMMVSVFAFVLCIIVVSIVSNSSINHAWTIAVTAGTVILAVMFIFADVMFGGSLIADIAGIILSFAIAIVYELVIFSVDYTATERLRFEDDDYYYFVKAVPKIKPLDEDERRE